MNVSVYNSLANLPKDIQSQFEYPNVDSFMLSLTWFRILETTVLEKSDTVRLYVVLDDSENPCFGLYCYSSGTRPHKLESLTTFYSTAFRPAVLKDHVNLDAACKCLATYFVNENPKLRELSFRYVPSDCRLMQTLSSQLASIGYSVHSKPFYENWYMLSDGLPFTDYYAELSSRVRNTIRRKETRLLRSHRMIIRYFEKPGADLHEGLQAYDQIYRKSWKKNEPFPEFIPRLAQDCAERGILLLAVLYINDEPAAAQFWIVDKRCALIYKLAYDESWKQFSPGSLLSKNVFEKVLDESKPLCIDYGIGSENYKKDWMKESRRLVNISAYRRNSILGLVAICRELIASYRKRAFR